MLRRACWLLLAILVVVFAAPPAVRAIEKEDRVRFGRSIVVDENEEAGDLVCIGCSIRMMGTCGDVVVIGGSVRIDGTVNGDVVAVGGGVHLDENASISGDVVTVGGGLSRHPNSTIKGQVTARSGPIVFLGLFLVPLVPVVLIVALIVWLVKPNRPRAAVRA
jgi:hypothetical protein